MNKWVGRLIFHIDADAFFASVEQACNPFLRGQSVVVCGQPIQQGVVTAASYEAKKHGVKAGMPVFEARTLLPSGIFIPVDIPKYIDFSTKLLAIYLKYTRKVEPFSIDEVFLDLTNQSDQPESLAREIKAKVKSELGVTISIGIAPNKLVAKIASDYKKPDGLCQVRPEEVGSFLANQPVKICPGIGPKTVEVFKSFNINTFADLSAVPEAKLRMMFGVNGSKIYLAARGIDHSPVIPLDELPLEKSMGHETTFPEWISSRDQLEGIIWELTSKVAFRLRERKLLSQGVRLKIKTESYGVAKKTFDKRLPNPTANEIEIAKNAVDLFFRHWNKQALKGIGVTAFALIPSVTAGEQLALFPPDLNKGKLGTAIDDLKNKYGEGIITHGTNMLMNGTKMKRGVSVEPRPIDDRNLRLFVL